MTFLAGLMLGLAGSGHCAVMCGPLVLAFGRRGELSTGRSLRHALTYHAGRLTVYVLAGLSAGVMGQALATLGFGRGLAVALGGLLIAGAAFGRVNTALGQTLWSTLGVRLSASAITWSRRHPVAGPAVMGATNGLLPCGLLYAAVVAAAGLGHVWDAFLFIGGFGLGTIPALFAVTSLASWMPATVRRRVARTAPFIMASIGVLLIARGVTDGHAHRHPPAQATMPTEAAVPAHVHLQ